jgi:transcriptional regulator with XRE-family HTH domain
MERREEIVKLGRILREARRKAGLSARELADRVGVHPSTVTLIERAEVEEPRPAKLTRLAEALDLDAADLLTLAGYESASKLPGFGIYLRTTTALPDRAIEELHGHYQYLQQKYGVGEAGPDDGEDEADEQ